MKTFAQVMLIAGLVGAAAIPAAADAQVYVRVGPPRPIFERRPPPPQYGYVWHAGYHRWDGARYVWVPGRYFCSAAAPRRVDRRTLGPRPARLLLAVMATGARPQQIIFYQQTLWGEPETGRPTGPGAPVLLGTANRVS